MLVNLLLLQHHNLSQRWLVFPLPTNRSFLKIKNHCSSGVYNNSSLHSRSSVCFATTTDRCAWGIELTWNLVMFGRTLSTCECACSTQECFDMSFWFNSSLTWLRPSTLALALPGVPRGGVICMKLPVLVGILMGWDVPEFKLDVPDTSDGLRRDWYGVEPWLPFLCSLCFI